MTSIAFMPKNPPSTPHSRAIAAAMKASGLSDAAIANEVGVSPGMVYQWKTARRPVPAPKARILADVLKVSDPGTLSAAYGEVAGNEGGNVVALPSQPIKPELAQSRVENDIDALRYAVSALVATMVIHRPAEAVDAAAAIRRQVPAKFLDRGFVQSLLAKLDVAAKPSRAAARAPSRPRANS